MSVYDEVARELEKLGDHRDAGLSAAALVLAGALDGENSATSKSMCAKALVDVMREVRALAPAQERDDEIERARKRRRERLDRQSAAGTSSSS